jgi:hypothetical protein
MTGRQGQRALRDGRGMAFQAGRAGGVLPARSVGVLDGRASEKESRPVRVVGGDHVVPFQDELAEARFPPSC